jgi:glycosyltransferase involved in cell wall biosynthesis
MKSLPPISIPFKVIGRFWTKPKVTPNGSPKVLMITQYLLLGGLERMILNLATSLKVDLNWEPRVFVYEHARHADASADMGKLFEAEGIPVTYFSKSKGFSIKAVLKMIETILREDVWVIHTHDLGALIYGAMAKIGCLGQVKLVHTQHSFVHIGRKKRYRYYELLFTSLVDELTVVSADTLETYRSLGVSSNKITLVPNGVRFVEQTQDKASAKRAALEAVDDRKIASSLESLSGAQLSEVRWILYLARVHGRKGQDHAVELWRTIEPEYRRKMALLFVGLETEKGQLEKLRRAIESAPDRERIFYLGPSQRPLAWLKAADIFLSCSEFEGMPLASIEASGSGLPLVLSSIAGHESLKSHSVQYPLNQPQEGGKELQKIVSQIQTEGSHYFDSLWKASEPVRNQYSVVQMARTYSGLYRSRVKVLFKT